jgi:hypothetical protein
MSLCFQYATTYLDAVMSMFFSSCRCPHHDVIAAALLLFVHIHYPCYHVTTHLVATRQGGDDLQMIKRGIMEVADVVLVNKADGATEAAATRAAAEYGGCLKLMPHRCVVACPS